MFILIKLCLLACLVFGMDAGGDISQPTRYCDYETFSARCDATDEVVHVHSAIYGRRSTGRCLEPSKVIDALRQDERYYGCYADVLSIADRKCSGRHQCVIGLPDPDFERVTPCYEDSRKYLEIGYTCEKGQQHCIKHFSTVTTPCYEELRKYLEISYTCPRSN